MPHGIQGGDHNVRVAHLVRLHLNLGHLVDPRCPLSLYGDFVVDDREVGGGQGDGGGVTNELSHLLPVLHLAVSRKGPDDGVHQETRDVALYLIALHNHMKRRRERGTLDEGTKRGRGRDIG